MIGTSAPRSRRTLAPEEPLNELGYTTARTQLVWPLGRMLLHRGDPNLTAPGVDDLDELRDAIDAFTARLRLDPVREFYSRAPDGRPPAEVADGYLRSAIARLHAVHVLRFDLGQVDRPPTGRVTAGSWVDQLAPRGAPQKIRAVIERYLRLHLDLDANLDRPQTVRHARDALRRLVTWMGEAHPEMASLADLHREHAEEFLRWLGTQTNQQTGAPLSIRVREGVRVCDLVPAVYRPQSRATARRRRRALPDGLARPFRISTWTAADRRNRAQDAGPLLVENPIRNGPKGADAPKTQRQRRPLCSQVSAGFRKWGQARTACVLKVKGSQVQILSARPKDAGQSHVWL